MDYSSNMNIIVTVISIIKQYGRCGLLSFAHQQSQKVKVGVEGGEKVCFLWGGGGSQEKAMTTHMKNSGDEGLSLVEPASRNPLLAPDPVSFSHLSL